MSYDFKAFAPQSLSFLNELSDNNNRDWFLANKTRYDETLKAPALALLDISAAELEKMTGLKATTKLFRPHRDVRFSKDKTPYHTHLHLLWTTGPTNWFFGLSNDYVTCGAGVMGFDKLQLERWRAFVADPDQTTQLGPLLNLDQSGLRISAPELKRIPSPFEKDHPESVHLRRKSLTVWHDFDGVQGLSIPDSLHQTFKTLQPLHEMLFEIFAP